MRAFVIVGTQRTGTTLIRTCLDSHPRVHCSGEVFKFGRRPYQGPDAYWRYCRSTPLRRLRKVFARRRQVYAFLDSLLTGDDRMAGFKLMYSHARRFPEVVEYVIERGLPIVHVVRRNCLRTLVSREMARVSSVYHQYEGARQNQISVRVDTKGLTAAIERIADEDDAWVRCLGAGARRLQVTYEDFVCNRASGERELLSFLGLDVVPLTSPLLRIGAAELRENIANFDEVAAVLRGTEFEGLLYTRDG